MITVTETFDAEYGMYKYSIDGKEFRASLVQLSPKMLKDILEKNGYVVGELTLIRN